MLFFVREIENKDILLFHALNVSYCKFLKIKFSFRTNWFFKPLFTYFRYKQEMHSVGLLVTIWSSK